MTLQRIGATELFLRQAKRVRGRILELGVGDDPYASIWDATTVRLDIDAELGPDVVGDAHCLPFRSGVFDWVVASQVFEHLHSPWIAANELERVTNSNGQILVAVPFLYPLHQVPHDYFRYTRWGLERLFGKLFDDIEILEYGGRVSVLTDLLATSTRSSSTVRRGLRNARKKLFEAHSAKRWPRLSRRLLAQPVKEYPLGYVVVASKRPSVMIGQS